LDNPDLQLQAARALACFCENCGPICVSSTSTFVKFYPRTDNVALYSFIPPALRAADVIKVFVETFTGVLEDLNEKPCSQDVIVICFRCLFDVVKRGLANAIDPTFVNAVLRFIVDHSEIKGNWPGSSTPVEASNTPVICSTRVLAQTLLFFDAFIQESQEAMAICTVQSFVSSLWGLFVEMMFNSFKNVQKQIRNEFLGLVILIMRVADTSLLDKYLLSKMFDLIQTIALLVPDVAVVVNYSVKSRQVRFTHEPVDIEMIVLGQDLALVLCEKDTLPQARPDFIEHQIAVLQGDVNKYLLKASDVLVVQALQLLHAFVTDVAHFVTSRGPEVLMQMILTQSEPKVVFYVLLLALKQFVVFRDPLFLKAVMALPRDDPKILSATLSLIAVLMEGEAEIVSVFMDLDGLELLKKCFVSNSAEVVVSAVDCARSIAPFQFQDIDQRLVFVLLDCADSAPALLRYDFVGLFLDLLDYKPFVDAALLWKSLSTNANVQRTIVHWWREEEERLDIRYDKGIIIDIDKPLDGHPLAGHSLRKVIVDKDWLLDKNQLSPPSAAYRLDFRARLFLFLRAFPELKESECKPTDQIKELMIRSYKELKRGAVWRELKEQLAQESIKPLHDDKLQIARKLEKMRDRSLAIQERQCEIWQKCEADRAAQEQKTYCQLNDGLKTAQYVAENYKQIVSSQPIAVTRAYQGRTVKGEDVLVRSSNLRTLQKAEISRSADEPADDALKIEKELEESYINDCLQDESISYLVQLMKTCNVPEVQKTDE
jgi:hypothetical protein